MYFPSMPRRKKHDQWYKKLFSNANLVRELLTSFVNEDFVAELDFSSLSRVDKSFISDEYKERESDVIYQVRYRRRRAYIYLLVEFQSRVDKFMALRMLSYVTQFYMMLVEGKRVRRLPPVFPIVLYNGDRKWNAPISLKELVEPPLPGNYVPEFYYYKIAENEFSKRELVSIRNAVSALFWVENSSIEEIRRNVSTILDLLRDEGAREIELFANWVAAYLGAQGQGDEMSEIHTREEAETMLATAAKKYEDKIYRKGREEGREETMVGMVLRAHAAGLNRTQIAGITGMNAEEIDTILAENGNSVREKRTRYRPSAGKRKKK